MPNNRQTLRHYSGSLIGGAVGDALGAPVEFMSLPDILHHFGANGISEYAMAYGRKGAITDDTQMTLFTAEGLILANVRYHEDALRHMPTSVYQAYLRWLSTQNEVPHHELLAHHGSCSIIDGLLIGHQALYSRRSPGNSCLSSLQSNRMGTLADPINNSKGCGGVMRIAPAGLLLKPADVFDIACEIAAITHGHPTGYLAAGSLAQIINALIHGADLNDAIALAIQTLGTKPHHEETLNAIHAALNAWKTEPVSFETVEKLGKGWIAEEALGIGLYCALAAGDDFEKGVCLGVNHGGDSDSTGAITGNILGARLGIDAIPSRYMDDLELMDVILELSNDLFDQRVGRISGA